MKPKTLEDHAKLHQEIIEYIRRYQAEHPRPSPSVQEICNATGISSKSRAWYLLLEMQEMGLVRFDQKGRARSIELLAPDDAFGGGE